MKVKQNISERDIIIQQIRKLSEIQYYTPAVYSVNPSNYKSETRTLGFRTTKLTYENFLDSYCSYTSNEKPTFHLMMDDDSIIIFYYKFDDLGCVIEHNLSYVPAPPVDLLLEKDDENFYMTSERMFLLLQKVYKYIRIDYDTNGYQEMIHTLVHMHIGLVKEYQDDDAENDDIRDYEFRIPIYGVVYPYDFIYLILKYIYKENTTYIERLLNDNIGRNCTLRQEELEKWYFILGSFNRD